MFSFHLFMFHFSLQSVRGDILLSTSVSSGPRIVLSYYVSVFLLLGPYLYSQATQDGDRGGNVLAFSSSKLGAFLVNPEHSILLSFFLTSMTQPISLKWKNSKGDCPGVFRPRSLANMSREAGVKIGDLDTDISKVSWALLKLLSFYMGTWQFTNFQLIVLYFVFLRRVKFLDLKSSSNLLWITDGERWESSGR